jgi:cytidylate kinase
MSFASTSDPDLPLGGSEFLESLRQAFARLPAAGSSGGFEPLSVTVAISREAGSRGGTIGRRAGRKLGWQVYHQELLEYLAQERHLGRELFAALDDPAAAWVEERLSQVPAASASSQQAPVRDLARIILAIGARGEAIIIGRGAGCLLPADSTLHVRIVAPFEDRVAYLSQLERLTREQAAEQVRLRDAERAAFVAEHFHRQAGEVHQYDLVLNSSLLGEDLSAELIAQAARGKIALRSRNQGMPRPAVPEMV